MNNKINGATPFTSRVTMSYETAKQINAHNIPNVKKYIKKAIKNLETNGNNDIVELTYNQTPYYQFNTLSLRIINTQDKTLRTAIDEITLNPEGSYKDIIKTYNILNDNYLKSEHPDNNPKEFLKYV